jgi:predicted MPP superfamily phosphohydrolase
MESFWRYSVDLFALALSALAQWKLLGWQAVSSPPRLRRMLLVLRVILIAWTSLSFVFALPPVYKSIPTESWKAWLKAGGIAWAMIATAMWLIESGFRFAGRLSPAFDPSRRQLLRATRACVLAVPAATLGYGTFIGRRNLRLQEASIPIRGLARDLDGLRLVQITDIHLSPFFRAPDLEYAIGMANETQPHLALVTGDLISVRGDPLEDCLRLLSRLKADAGVIGCLGNHEIAARCEDYVTRRSAKMGIRFLRRESQQLRFGKAHVNFAGVDYQKRSEPYLVGAEGLVRPSELNILLSHNPDVFPVAAGMGFDLTVAGHTHGGQVTVEILHQYLNVARFYTPYVYGRYELDGRYAYVSRGLGTIGVPARVGAPPEVSLIKLCAT